MILIKCGNCNKECYKYPYQIKKVNFCSNKCFIEFRRIGLIDGEFGRLEVLEFDCIDKGISKFKCRCSCDRIISVRAASLKNGNTTKCKNCKNRKYVGEVSGKYFADLRYSAKDRKIPFDITQDDIWDQFLKQGKRCCYSGLELTWQDGTYGDRGTASVDRIDSTKGYAKNNIQIVHKKVNSLKMGLTEEDLLLLCKYIYNYRNLEDYNLEQNVI